MNTTMSYTDYRMTIWTLAAFALLAVGAGRAAAQSPATGVTEDATWTALSPAELETLVGPIALYPDDLIAIVLPASTYPLQVVQASRYLEARESNPELEPDADWDDSIVALLNYPEALALLNDDLDWTYDLGEAVVYQQGDVLNAVQAFRGVAQNAGNLETDDRQVVAVEDDGAITISPADPEVIYVPYYDPASVVVYQPAPVYHYYPYGYPVYYYPYPYGYSFRAGLFWGVTSAFLVSWHDHYLHVRHPSYFGHPYYGYTYYDPWYARTNIYLNVNHYGSNYRWRPSYHDGGRPRHYAGFSRLRDRNYVRTPAERRIRSGWVRDRSNDGGFRAPRRDAAPATIDEQRARRIRSGRTTADDLQARNRSARTRDLNGVGGRVGARTPATSPNRGAGSLRSRGNDAGLRTPQRNTAPATLDEQRARRIRSGRTANTVPEATANRSARRQTPVQNNGRRAQSRSGDLGNALGRIAGGARANGQPRALARQGSSSPATLGGIARGSRIDAQPRALARQGSASRGTLGRIAPQTRVQPQSNARMRSGIGREQPMSPPRARAPSRNASAGAASRADFGRSRGATRSAGNAQPRNAGGRANRGGGRAR